LDVPSMEGLDLSGLHMATGNLVYTFAADGQPIWAARKTRRWCSPTQCL